MIFKRSKRWSLQGSMIRNVMSLGRVSQSSLPIYWTQLTRGKSGLTRCCIFRGNDLPVDLASACCFSWIAYGRQSEEP